MRGKPVIAEIYPKACYGLALADFLPARLLSIAKTKAPSRRKAIAALQQCAWLAREHVRIHDIEAALESEDDFDAQLSAAALARLALENAPFDSPGSIDCIAPVVSDSWNQYKQRRLTKAPF